MSELAFLPYIVTAQLDVQERNAAEAYFQQVSQLNERTQQAVRQYVGHAPVGRGSWNVTDLVVNQPLWRGDWNVTPPTNPPTNCSVDESALNFHLTNNSIVNNWVTEPNPLDTRVNEDAVNSNYSLCSICCASYRTAIQRRSKKMKKMFTMGRVNNQGHQYA